MKSFNNEILHGKTAVGEQKGVVPLQKLKCRFRKSIRPLEYVVTSMKYDI